MDKLCKYSIYNKKTRCKIIINFRKNFIYVYINGNIN